MGVVHGHMTIYGYNRWQGSCVPVGQAPHTPVQIQTHHLIRGQMGRQMACQTGVRWHARRVSDGMSADMTGGMSDDMSDDVTYGMSDDVSDAMSDGVPWQVSYSNKKMSWYTAYGP